MRWYWSSRLAGWMLLVLIVFGVFGVIVAALGAAGQLSGQNPPTPTPIDTQLPTL